MERGGLEPQRPFRTEEEFNASLAHYSARRKGVRAAENIFALDSALLRISPVPFVRYTDPRNLVTWKRQMKLEFESPPPSRAIRPQPDGQRPILATQQEQEHDTRYHFHLSAFI